MMNLSIAVSREVLAILDGRAPTKARARGVRQQPEDEVVPCAEGGWRSSWHERMNEDEHAYDERAFGGGEREAT